MSSDAVAVSGWEWHCGEMNQPTDALTMISYLIATAMLLPLGWWLKSERLFGFGDWVVSLFH